MFGFYCLYCELHTPRKELSTELYIVSDTQNTAHGSMHDVNSFTHRQMKVIHRQR